MHRLAIFRDIIKTELPETKTKTTRFKTKTKTETKTMPVEIMTKTMVVETAKTMQFPFMMVSQQSTKQTLTYY
jgi:hypothetical protein